LKSFFSYAKGAKVYDCSMKYVFLAIFVLLAAQPVQVSSCQMHDAQQTAYSGSHDMGHDGEQAMDCCDHEPAMPTHQCDSMFHCGACPAGVLAFSSLMINTVFQTNTRLYLPDTGEPLSSFTPPPYKPPIA
jgi:hypothetical protein